MELTSLHNKAPSGPGRSKPLSPQDTLPLCDREVARGLMTLPLARPHPSQEPGGPALLKWPDHQEPRELTWRSSQLQ